MSAREAPGRSLALVRLGLWTLLAGALAPSAAWATNGPKLVSYGARAAGRGGVDFAYADDGTGPATNPAGMAFVYGNRLDNNWAIIRPNVTWKNSFGSFTHNELFFPVPAYSFGATFDPFAPWQIKNLFRLGTWGLSKEEQEADRLEADPEAPQLSEEELRYGSRVRIGLGVFPVTGGKIRLKNMVTSGFSYPLHWETDTLTLAIAPSFAFRVTDRLSFGATLQVIYSKFELDGGIAQPSFLLRDDFETAQAILSVAPQIITDADLDDAFTWGVSWRIGTMFQATDWLTLGAVFQDRTYSADYLGKATVSAEDEVRRLTNGNNALLQVVDPAVNPSLGFTSVYDLRVQEYEFPRMVGLGAALRPHRRFSIGFDYTWIDWSMLKTFKVRLSNGSNPNLDIMTSPSIAVRVPLRMRDQHVVAFGLTVLALEGEDLVEGVPKWALSLRTGYNYARSSVPKRTTLPQLPIIGEHHISAGFTLHWGPLIDLSFAWEWALPRTIDVDYHQGDFTLSGSEQSVDIMLFQFGLGVNF